MSSARGSTPQPRVPKPKAGSPPGKPPAEHDKIKMAFLWKCLHMCKQAVPSVTTLAAVCLGLKAIACARQAIASDRQQADEWVENACWFIVAAFAIDFFDGALARLLNACSAIGGALDFLADSTAYVLAPGVMLIALCGQVGWAYGSLWLCLGAFRSSRQEGDDVKTDRKAGRFYGLISNHAACQLALIVLVSVQKGWDVHRRPEILGFLVAPLCIAMVCPLWYWKITYGPTWWSVTIYSFLVGVLVCAYMKTGAEVLLLLNTLYIVLGPTVDERFYTVLPILAGLATWVCGGLSIVLHMVAPRSQVFWQQPSFWICVAFSVDSIFALETNRKSTRALRLQSGFVALTVAPLFLILDDSSQPLSWLSATLFSLASLYRRSVAVAGHVDVAEDYSLGLPSALGGAVLAAMHFANYESVILQSIGIVLAIAFVAPIRCCRLYQKKSVVKRWCAVLGHCLVLTALAGGFPDIAIGMLISLTLASFALAQK